MNIEETLERLKLLANGGYYGKQPPFVGQIETILLQPAVVEIARLTTLVQGGRSDQAVAELKRLPQRESVDVPLDATELSPRIVSTLARLGVTTIGEAAARAPAEYAAIKNFGRTSYRELLMVVRKHLDPGYGDEDRFSAELTAAAQRTSLPA